MFFLMYQLNINIMSTVISNITVVINKISRDWEMRNSNLDTVAISLYNPQIKLTYKQQIVS